MSTIDIFLKALKNRLSNNIASYVSRCYNTPKTVKAYKEYTLEVWLLQGEEKILISTAAKTDKVVTEEDKERIMESLYIATIENVLKRYGI